MRAHEPGASAINEKACCGRLIPCTEHYYRYCLLLPNDLNCDQHVGRPVARYPSADALAFQADFPDRSNRVDGSENVHIALGILTSRNPEFPLSIVRDSGNSNQLLFKLVVHSIENL